MTGQPWWDALPAVETGVPCGSGTHRLRWEDGHLSLPAHPDAEAELVLAALGGDKAACVEVAEAWHRHTEDLDVLALGPRGAADDIRVSWDDVQEFRSSRPTGGAGRPYGPAGLTGSPRSGGAWPASQPMRPGPRAPLPHAVPARPARADEVARLRTSRLDMLSLLALGPAFQMVLSGTVAAAWADGGARAGERAANRPALEAALTGRLAPAAAAWLGIDPDQVDARLQEDPGWGSLRVTGSRGARHLRACLPAGWLATVWACGLAEVGGHLVVGVERAAWPDATVLAVPEPGQDPVLLDVRAAMDAGTPGDPAHWEVTSGHAGRPGEPDDQPAAGGPHEEEADRP